ncbi:MAG TPA: DUF72 domain-containing protein [Solirubrobacter sp.]|nr:DUF72 domain-containing protein [Solirubrobacter sp.]
MRPVHIGCSGWQYRDWRGGAFYPERLPQARWLSWYAGVFDTVEVNSTFYRLARVDAVARWVDAVPDGFVFAVKASRYMTHVRRLREVREPFARFWSAIAPLVESGKLGPVLWQLPANFRRDEDRLADLLSVLPEGPRWAFEFRDASWFTEDVFGLLRAFGAALVIGDHPSRGFQPLELTADWSFVRFHYGRRGRRGNYSERELQEWAARLRTLAAEAEIFAYFNNDWEAFAPRNALRLRSLLEP